MINLSIMQALKAHHLINNKTKVYINIYIF